jgi:hypothetical protein
MTWLLDEGGLLFTGEVGGRKGTWRVRADGSELTLLADLFTTHMALAPDGTQLVALVEREEAGTTTDVVILDLPSPEATPSSE